MHLISESGNIKTKDLYVSREVRLKSESGDIMCEGITNGHIVAETEEDGDFLARYARRGKHYNIVLVLYSYVLMQQLS